MLKNKFLVGLDEVSGEINSNCDLGLKDSSIAFFANALKAKTVRVWVKTPEIINVLENDDIEFKLTGIQNLNSYLYELKKAGVERFLLLDWEFVYPYGYKASDGWVVPSPKTERDMYARFMRLQRKVHAEIASNFTEIEYFESTNEPDGVGGTFLHKNGYNLNKDLDFNRDFIFTRDEIEDIILDLNYYSNEGIKSANKDAKMLFPSFWNNDTAPEFIDNIYNKIESNKYPTIKQKHSTKITDFFEIFSFHPYNLKSVEIDEYWESTQVKLREVMLKHNNPDMKVWYTEVGWSDFIREKEKEKIGDRHVKVFEVVQEKFPWVETIFPFRLFTLANKPENEGENNFGLVYNEFDWNMPLVPKKAFITLYKYINGDDADVNHLYELSPEHHDEYFPSYKISGEGKKVLVLGNKFSYQPKAKWNRWNLNESGLGATKEGEDYIHVLKNLTNDFSFDVFNIEKYEREIAYKPTLEKLYALKEIKPDITIIQLGDFFMPCNINDYSLKDSLIDFINNFKDISKIILVKPFVGTDKVNSIYDEVIKETAVEFIDSNEVIENVDGFIKTPYLNKDPNFVPTSIGHKALAEEIYKKIQ